MERWWLSRSIHITGGCGLALYNYRSVCTVQQEGIMPPSPVVGGEGLPLALAGGKGLIKLRG